MKKGFLIIAYLLIGMTVALANHKLSNKETESPLIACLEDKDNKDREIDTIATTLDEWFPLLKEKAKEGWKFQRLIYQEGKDVLLVIDRPIPNPQNKSSVSERNVEPVIHSSAGLHKNNGASDCASQLQRRCWCLFCNQSVNA